jgi:hypothetical protein
VPGEKSKMVSVSLNNVIVPSHLEWRVQGEDQLLFEIYTGNLIVQFPGGDTTKRDTYSTYLPLSVDPDGSVNIRTYGTDDALPTINSAIVVTPAGASLEKDKTTVSVDSWALQVTPQSFPGIGGHPPCLILSCDLAIRNGIIIRVDYHVTVTTPLSTRLGNVNLDPSAAPQ